MCVCIVWGVLVEVLCLYECVGWCVYLRYSICVGVGGEVDRCGRKVVFYLFVC